ncbi:MAG: hypothetical protein COB83_13165 [Gammaproteobacteria bacterium]|nr:MAG: hypothetical protein COB83_13165 [Gammaproteobacteria bacterium]
MTPRNTVRPVHKKTTEVAFIITLAFYLYFTVKRRIVVLIQGGCTELTLVITPDILSYTLRASFQLFKFVPDKFVSTSNAEVVSIGKLKVKY